MVIREALQDSIHLTRETSGSTMTVSFLGGLVDAFKTCGWYVVLEKEITFDYIIRSRSELTKRNGRIDLVAQKRGYLPVAVEFDSCNNPKYKSIEKLVQFPGIGMSVIAGRSSVAAPDRVESVLNERSVYDCVELWLVSIGQRKAWSFIKDGRREFTETVFDDSSVGRQRIEDCLRNKGKESVQTSLDESSSDEFDS